MTAGADARSPDTASAAVRSVAFLRRYAVWIAFFLVVAFFALSGGEEQPRPSGPEATPEADKAAGLTVPSAKRADAERELIRPFFIRWADRILFGSDANAFWEPPETLSEHEIRRHIYNHIHPFKRFIQQLYLPQGVLSKVAHENFERLFDMPPAEDWFY